MATSLLLDLSVFAADPLTRRMLADNRILLPGSNVVEMTQTIPASGAISVAVPSASTILIASPVAAPAQTNYVTDTGVVVTTPVASPYLVQPLTPPDLTVTFTLTAGGTFTFEAVGSILVVPLPSTGIAIANNGPNSTSVHLIQAT